MKRYIPEKDFPPYAFVPGKHPHPEKENGHMFGTKVNSEKLEDYQDSSAYLYAVDLYNHGYYWESHVWWECLWHLENRKGDLADFLKALIKLAAGKLKIKMGQKEVANNHILRAFELIKDLNNRHVILAGLELEQILEDYDKLKLNHFDG